MLYASKVFWDVPLRITAVGLHLRPVSQHENIFQLSSGLLRLLMHFCPQNCLCCRDVFVLFCFVCAAILSKLCSALIPQCGGCLSDAGADASVMITPYSKWLKSHVLPVQHLAEQQLSLSTLSACLMSYLHITQSGKACCLHKKRKARCESTFIFLWRRYRWKQREGQPMSWYDNRNMWQFLLWQVSFFLIIGSNLN